MEDERDRRTESLLDLPLRGDAGPTDEAPAVTDLEAAGPARGPLLDAPAELAVGRPQPVSAAVPGAPSDRPAEEPQIAPFLGRLKAGLADLVAHLGVVGLLAVGTRLLGARLAGAGWSVLVTVLAFSFLYTIPALLVWGRTPGGAVAGLVVQGPDGGTPTAPQAARRWIAQWVTWLLAGLPGLVRLADRWSGTRTVVR